MMGSLCNLPIDYFNTLLYNGIIKKGGTPKLVSGLDERNAIQFVEHFGSYQKNFEKVLDR
jgi:hypothetical protein